MWDPPGSQHLHLSRGDGGCVGRPTLRGPPPPRRCRRHVCAAEVGGAAEPPRSCARLDVRIPAHVAQIKFKLEVFLTVLWPYRCSRHGSECCGCKGFLLSHAGSLKSKSCLAVSKATTCGIIKKDEALVCQRYGILAGREHFIFICYEESNVSLPAKLRRRNGDRAVQVNQDNPKNSEDVCERPGRTSTGEVLLVPAASRLGLVPARSRGADFTSHLGSISDASPGNAGHGGQHTHHPSPQSWEEAQGLKKKRKVEHCAGFPFLLSLYGSVDFEFRSALAPLPQEGREQPQLKVCPKAAASRTVGRGIHRRRSAQLPRRAIRNSVITAIHIRLSNGNAMHNFEGRRCGVTAAYRHKGILLVEDSDYHIIISRLSWYWSLPALC
ncbi:uncharacterized protein LOC118249468 [Cygnus atratus]|uniref:uncharacterized protein LOC118249468 n=1 Tax=Cygnus atratus TaxID=8868 RepID=UPI0021B83F29|nr:uncharacterized protein LOC118249468 [Cygnus atratus]